MSVTGAGIHRCPGRRSRMPHSQYHDMAGLLAPTSPRQLIVVLYAILTVLMHPDAETGVSD